MLVVKVPGVLFSGRRSGVVSFPVPGRPGQLPELLHPASLLARKQ